MPAYEPLTVDQITNNIEVLIGDAEEQQIYDTQHRRRLQQAYDGGEELTNPKNLWIVQHDGESKVDWKNRSKHLRSGVNPCRLIPDKITSFMTNGTVVLQHEDEELQQRVNDAQEAAGWTTMKRREVERLCSIFGTVGVGLFWNKQRQIVDYSWSEVDQLLPVQSSQDANTLDALMIRRTAENFRGKVVKFSELIDIWTPIERDRIAKGPKSDISKDLSIMERMTLRRNRYISLVEDRVNPFGTIPFAPFKARPSARVGTWFALSDINEAHKTLEFILEQINNLAEVMDKQSFAQLVVIGETEEGKVKVGPSTPLVLDNSKTGGSDAKYIIPGSSSQHLLEVIEAFYRYSFEVEGVPLVAVRTMEAPESGVALKLKLQPLQEITEERRQRHAEAEKRLWILTAMALDIFGDRFRATGEFDRVFTPEEARVTFETIGEGLTVTHMNDFNSTDESDDLLRIEQKRSMGLQTPYESWLESGHIGTRDDFMQWEADRIEQERELQMMERAGSGVIVPEAPIESAPGLTIDESLEAMNAERLNNA